MMFKLVGLVVAVGATVVLLMLIGRYLSPTDQLVKADVIVVVSGGDTAARTLAGVKLYQDGWAPLLIFSGAASDPASPSNAQIMRSIAIGQGVPSDVITVEDQAKTTHQNATDVSAIVKVLDQKRIILVTSPYHQRRASLEFQAQLGPDVQIINQPASDKSWSWRWWWLSPYGWYVTSGELIRTAFTLVAQRT